MDRRVAELAQVAGIVKPVGVLADDARVIARVVDHHVEDEGDAGAVQRGDERAELGGAAEARLDRAVVGIGVVGPVAVIAALARRTGRLLRRRRNPQGADAEVGEVADLAAHADEVAAVPRLRVRRIEAAGEAEVVVAVEPLAKRSTSAR